MTTNLPWVDVEACTLPTEDRPLRAAEFDDLFSEHLLGITKHAATNVSMRLDNEQGLADWVEDLTARESSCCSFFTFSLTQAADELTLAIVVPETRVAILAALTGRAEAMRQRRAE